MIYDFITIGGGGSGLFCNVNLPKESKKLILEKNKIVGTKVLLSGGERANLTNIHIDPENDYFSCNKKACIGFLNRFTNYDIIDFFEKNGVKTNIEDRGRVITASGNAKDIVNLLLKKAIENNTHIVKNTNILKVSKNVDVYTIKTNQNEYKTKNLIIASGGKSFPQVGTDGFGYNIAKQFGLKIIKPYKGLSGVVLKQDVSKFSGSSIQASISLYYEDNLVYDEFGPLLFTHFGLSGPIIYNMVLGLGEYINCKNLEEDYEKFKLTINFNLKHTTKKITRYFNINEKNRKFDFDIQSIKSWKESKVSGGGVDTNELTKYLESKKHPGLFFIGEVVDITGKTGGFNLQWAWSSAYCCALKFNTSQKA